MRSRAWDGSPSSRIPPARGWPCGSRIPTPRTCNRNRQVLEGIHRDGPKGCPPPPRGPGVAPSPRGPGGGGPAAKEEVKTKAEMGEQGGREGAVMGRNACEESG